MSKIGAEQGELAIARKVRGSQPLALDSKVRFESSLKRQTSQSQQGPGLIAHQPFGLGIAPKDNIDTPPPTYNATQSLDFGDIAQLIELNGGEQSETFNLLSSGLSSRDLPNIVIVSSANGPGQSTIATAGPNILIPAAVYADWLDIGAVNNNTAMQFNQAFLSFLNRGNPNKN